MPSIESSEKKKFTVWLKNIHTFCQKSMSGDTIWEKRRKNVLLIFCSFIQIHDLLIDIAIL